MPTLRVALRDLQLTVLVTDPPEHMLAPLDMTVLLESVLEALMVSAAVPVPRCTPSTLRNGDDPGIALDIDQCPCFNCFYSISTHGVSLHVMEAVFRPSDYILPNRVFTIWGETSKSPGEQIRRLCRGAGQREVDFLA